MKNKINIDLTQLNSTDKRNLNKTFLDAIQRFYEDPKNKMAFAMWKMERDRVSQGQ